MPTLIALILSTILAYLPAMLFGDELSQATEIFLSTTIGLVSFATIKWGLRRLRGD